MYVQLQFYDCVESVDNGPRIDTYRMRCLVLPRISKVEVCVSTEADILCRVLVSMINLPYSQEYANYNMFYY